MRLLLLLDAWGGREREGRLLTPVMVMLAPCSYYSRGSCGCVCNDATDLICPLLLWLCSVWWVAL